MCDQNEYNGYTNRATYIIMLELVDDMYPRDEVRDMFGGRKPGRSEMVDAIREAVEEFLTDEAGGNSDSLVFSYAMEFLRSVDYYDLADTILADVPDDDDDDASEADNA